MIQRYIPAKLLLLIGCLCAPFLLSAQKQKIAHPLPNWQNLDFKESGMFGISTEKAYKELLGDKKHVPVVVAVIDGGVDINHEDLKNSIWTNPGETEDNNIDDDKNGYADDVHGWDFIGSIAKGNVQYDNMELTRQLKQGLAKYKYAKVDTLKPDELVKYKQYQKMDRELNLKIEEAQHNLEGILGFNTVLERILREMGKTNPTFQDWERYQSQTWQVLGVRRAVLENWPEDGFKAFKEDEIDAEIKQLRERINFHYNLDFESRDTVGDNYFNSNEHFYGNPNVGGPGDDHGTHVSGIIGAARDNDLGVKGVANDVRIMSVRTVPNGDERDKDVANAIRYAAANGAKVINMSFGKPYSQDKKAVDEAVKFAMSKDVLIIHAAGNDNLDVDTAKNFPNKTYADNSGVADGWIEVGASGFLDDQNLKASFSNYGKNTVDVFAPGVQIRSSVSGSHYKVYDGTSMASPVVAGLAALIRSYYPKLSAVQVKEIILKSVTKIDHRVELKVNNSEKDKKFKLDFADLCQTGGIVNAYDALKLAATY
jgi:subtilisin family serine protease